MNIVIPIVQNGDRLRDAIEEAILTGVHAPGERLEEVVLANRYGVSRTPVREALKQLAAAGLVDMAPRKGATVAVLSPARLVEMFQVMAEFEALAARLAARRLTQEDQETLLIAHTGCISAADLGPDAYYYANEVFHFAIYEASRSAFLIEQAKALHRRLKPYRRIQLQARNRVQNSLKEHESIVETIIAGDGEQAAIAARDHVLVQGERFADMICGLSASGIKAAV